MSTRWIRELYFPGHPDISCVYASYVLAAIQIIATLVLIFARDVWSLGCVIIIVLALGLQNWFLVGIVLAKIRTVRRPVGHFTMYPDDEPLADVPWTKAFGGFIVSAITVALWFAFTHGYAT